ncbi:MAG: 3-hydroxy-2-methylbutyryl-CoA dehydrogenase [Gammaproteobacteria bacterium RIFCSPHIGHO2_12_FULL_41_15]|nr:MAG: 3-hydroxy-2-methylbutyryl-CoA dehydrogenase [Gammaproteobacteria bacterium RIFCSPHIGHO2_12_FULL_41_15]
MELNNKTAIITGAASGLGAATARLFSQQGVTVVLIDLQADKLASTANALGAEYYACDLTDTAQVESTVSKIFEKHHSVEVLLNCAGVATGERIVGRKGVMPLDHFSKVVNINLIAAFDMMRLVSAHMVKQKAVTDDGERGVIINVSSVAAFDGQLGQAAYSASKGGLAAMTLPAARELGQFGIRVMAIAPGVMQTPMVDGLKQEIIESIVRQVPFPKRFGRPDEFAQLCQHIVQNSMLNGEVIRFDGGVRLV